MEICKLCGRDTNSLYHIAEQTVLDMIRQDHPEWVAEDGSCEKCVEYYNEFDKHVEVIVVKPDNP